MAEIQDLSVTDASNTGRWPENMPFSDVNDAGRADEGLLARWYKDTDGSITASGSSNAFTATSNRTISAYFNNLEIMFTANHSITGAATFNLNGLGAKTIKRYNGSDLAQGDIISDQPCLVVYKSSPDVWFLVSAPAALTGNSFVDLDENASPGNPAADDARLYAFDDSGTTMVAYRDSAGTIRELLGRATQAEMETGTDVRQGVTVGRQHFHPGHPKAGANFNGVTAAFRGGDYGMASVTDNAVGNWTLQFDTAFQNTNYWAAGVARAASGTLETNLALGTEGGTKTTSAIQIFANLNNALVDTSEIGITFWGNLP